jgi:hypothetical protein
MHIVLDEHYRDPCRCYLSHQGTQALRVPRPEARGWLVEEQHVRLEGQGPRQLHQTPVPMGQGRRRLLQRPAVSNKRQQLLSRLPTRCGAPRPMEERERRPQFPAVQG